MEGGRRGKEVREGGERKRGREERERGERKEREEREEREGGEEGEKKHDYCIVSTGSLHFAENLFSFSMICFALRQLSHWKPSVQMFSW